MGRGEAAETARVMTGEFALPWPLCRKCEDGVLLPLSDYGRDGATVTYKAWVCNKPGCGYHMRIDNGEVSIGEHLQASTR